MTFPNGYHLVVKHDCPTCTLIEPEIRKLADNDSIGPSLHIYVQDEPAYLSDLSQSNNDFSLEQSFNLDIEIVPTLIRYEAGKETSRSVGWVREEWRNLLGITSFGENLPELRPGCGSLTVMPGAQGFLESRFGHLPLHSRKIKIGDFDDPIEQAFERGWSDGLPIIPPTGERIMRMLTGENLS